MLMQDYNQFNTILRKNQLLDVHFHSQKLSNDHLVSHARLSMHPFTSLLFMNIKKHSTKMLNKSLMYHPKAPL